MPLKKTVYRGKHAIKTLISVGIAGLIAVVLGLVIGLVTINNVATPYFIFAVTFLGVNEFFAAYLVFVARRNKGIYLASIISLFVICEGFGALAIILNNFAMTQIAWLLPLTLFFYILAEIYDDGTINARIIGPIIVIIVAALMLIWPAANNSNFMRIIGIILYAITALLMLIYFIAFLVSFSRKNKRDDLTLGSVKFAYDVPTNDEAALDSRSSSTDFKELQNIPRIYEGSVWRIDDLGIKNIATYIHNYINECIDTINYMLELAKNRISSVEDYNSFVSQYNTWIDNLNDDQPKMLRFLENIANCYFLDVDNGTCIHFDFYNYEIKRTFTDDKDCFTIKITGFSRTFHHPKAMFGKDKVEFSVPASYWSIIKAGYHSQEEDSQVNQHGYHYPGTPMPEED